MVGSAPSTTPRLTSACSPNIAVMPNAEVAAERIARAQAPPARRATPAAEHARDGDDADEAQLLADDGHDVVGVRLGQEEQLLLARRRGRARVTPPEPIEISDSVI